MARQHISSKHKTGRYIWMVATLCAAPLVTANVAYAQTAGQITRESYAPPILRSTGGGIIITSDTSTDIPEGADALSVTPAGLDVTGGFPELQAVTDQIEARLKNKQVKASALFEAAKELEAAYAHHGYVLTRITLPPQQIENGTRLKLIVTDGFIQSIDVSGLPQEVQPQVLALLERLKGKRRLTQRDLERQMLLVSDIPGLFVTSALKAGEVAGATILVLTGTHKANQFSASLDNGLSRPLGQYTANLTADFNNYFGAGEVIYFRVGSYPGFTADVFDDMPRNRQLVAGLTTPLGYDGWWLNIEGVDSRTNPKSSFPYHIEDHYQRFSVGLGYHWLRSRNLNTNTTFAFEVSDAEQTMHFNGQTDWAKDQLRTIQIKQAFDAYLPWDASINGSLALTLGLDAFGARHPTTALPMTRYGASPVYQKLAFNLGYMQTIALENGQALDLTWTSSGQTSFGDPLAASEQMGMGAQEKMSSLDAGTVQGDSALTTRAEFAFPNSVALPETWSGYNAQATPYLFGAGSISKVVATAANNESTSRAYSYGVGIRLNLTQPEQRESLSVSAEFARGRVIGSKESNRFNFKVAVAF